MDGLFTFLQSIFVDNAMLAKDHKALVSAIKDGDCSISEATATVPTHSKKRGSR
jgi:hypothetical protein